MKILIASDHAGFELKSKLVPFLRQLGYEVSDMGPASFDPTDDYPDFVLSMARELSNFVSNSTSRAVVGIILGGSGEGEAMAANRVAGIRAAVYYGGPMEIIHLSREHNNANILSLGARFLSEEEAKVAVKLWLETPFSADARHVRRITKIDSIK